MHKLSHATPSLPAAVRQPSPYSLLSLPGENIKFLLGRTANHGFGSNPQYRAYTLDQPIP